VRAGRSAPTRMKSRNCCLSSAELHVRIHPAPAGSLLRTGFRADLQKRVFAFDTIEGIHRIASVTWLGGLHRHYVAFSAKRPRFFSESFRETQWVRYSPSIVGSPLRLKRSVWRRGVRVT
jgi:hypothetical protein